MFESLPSSNNEGPTPRTSGDVPNDKTTSIINNSTEVWFDENKIMISKQVEMCDDRLRKKQKICFDNVDEVDKICHELSVI